MGNRAYVICRKGQKKKKKKKKRLSTITKGLQSLIKSSEVLNLEQFYNNLKNSEISNESCLYSQYMQKYTKCCQNERKSG